MQLKRSLDLSLYLVTDRKLAGHRNLLEVVQKAIKGGVTVVQLREKDLSTREFYELGIRAKELLPPDVPLLIDDRLDLALAIGTDGLHLGQRDLPVEIARKLLGPPAIIGLSVENLSQLQAAKQLPVDLPGYQSGFLHPHQNRYRTGLGARWSENSQRIDLPAAGSHWRYK